MKDPKQTAQRGIEAFIYQLGYAIDEEGKNVMNKFTTHYETISLLGDLGFKIPKDETKVCKNIKEVFAFVKHWEEKRESYPYEIDGMVVKANSLDIQDQCGFTSHHPRWAIAFKFKAKQATSKLLNVEYQIGKIGSVTPVAKIEPVALAGVTVSSISLHNEDFIVSKDLRLGDTVLVERAGDVIPYIVKSLEELRDGSEQKIDFPKECPSCGTTLERAESEAAWRCSNVLCEAQVLQKMIFHVSKDAMDIDGFGKSIVEKFYELGFIKSIADIYSLEYEKLAELEGFGQKSIDNLRGAIEKAKQNPISRVLHSLSIHHLGKKASKLIAQQINHILDLASWDQEHFIQIKDIGPVVAQNVQAFFSEEENINLLKQMEGYGVNFKQTEEDKPLVVADDAPLVGKSILFTGSLQQMGRKEAQGLAANAGAKNISAVSKKLDILVVGEKAGSKLKKAQDIGTIQIITEQEFLDIINQNA
jgi:DNA ligase (NAD+)